MPMQSRCPICPSTMTAMSRWSMQNRWEGLHKPADHQLQHFQYMLHTLQKASRNSFRLAFFCALLRASL